MLGVLKKVNHDEVLQRLRDEREQLIAKINDDARRATDLAFDAECGDEDAKARQARLLDKCAEGRERLSQIAAAIASGEKAAAEAARREQERQRAQHERQAEACATKVARSAADLIRALQTVEQHFAELATDREKLQTKARAAGREDLVHASKIATLPYALTGALNLHAPLLARAMGVTPPARKEVSVLDVLARGKEVKEDA
ncbi:MAG: hypothetical protein GXP06_13900 [Alphaproteobacteria bacterium]|nr:hypothetical protein [Alphaproteobacteria bacterium]